MRPDHLDEARIQELLDGVLPAPEATRAREHVKGCAVCAQMLEEAREEERVVSALLDRLDTPPPRVEVGPVLAAASDPASFAVDARGRRNRWVAAVLLATGVAGAAYAIPGSPLRAWLNELIPKVFDRKEPSRIEVSEPTVQPSKLSGIAVAPGPSFVIKFTRPSEGTVRISLVEGVGEHLVVRAPAGTATFQSGPDALVIDSRVASTTFEIDIPRSAPHVEIRVEGERIFLKDRDRTEPVLQGASGVIPLARPSR